MATTTPRDQNLYSLVNVQESRLTHTERQLKLQAETGGNRREGRLEIPLLGVKIGLRMLHSTRNVASILVTINGK